MVKKINRKAEKDKRHLRVRKKYLEQQNAQDYVFAEQIKTYLFK